MLATASEVPLISTGSMGGVELQNVALAPISTCPPTAEHTAGSMEAVSAGEDEEGQQFSEEQPQAPLSS